MRTGVIAQKVGMSRIFTEDGLNIPVTVLKLDNCQVVAVKTTESHGYNAVQLGFGEAKRLKSPQKGHLKGNGNFRHLREFRVDDVESVQVGDRVDVTQFEVGDFVDITGVSRGKGFAGVVKRHHFAGGPKTHGQSDRHRAPGSVGAGTTPGRVFKGTKMAGRMGGETVTVRHLLVCRADAERNLLLVRGAVPGVDSGLLLIRKSNKGKK